MPFAVMTFLVSLGGIAGLFALKYVELRRRKMLAPHVRYRLDRFAVELKKTLMYSRARLRKLGPLSILITRYFIHEAALGLASLARTGERQARKLADLVSHKRSFERRAPRSEFLKQVTDHKIENGVTEPVPAPTQIQAPAPTRRRKKI